VADVITNLEKQSMNEQETDDEIMATEQNPNNAWRGVTVDYKIKQRKSPFRSNANSALQRQTTQQKQEHQRDVTTTDQTKLRINENLNNEDYQFE
jgi:hypothetical protein